MVSIILSGGTMTPRKKGQSIKKHIEEHEKNKWINEYIRLSGSSFAEAEASYNEVFHK